MKKLVFEHKFYVVNLNWNYIVNLNWNWVFNIAGISTNGR